MQGKGVEGEKELQATSASATSSLPNPTALQIPTANTSTSLSTKANRRIVSLRFGRLIAGLRHVPETVRGFACRTIVTLRSPPHHSVRGSLKTTLPGRNFRKTRGKGEEAGKGTKRNYFKVFLFFMTTVVGLCRALITVQRWNGNGTLTVIGLLYQDVYR